MIPLRIASSRFPTTQLLSVAQKRSLSTKGTAAVTKLKQVLEEYRVQHYSQEIPSRFKKEVISAAKRREDGLITVDGLDRVIHNIHAAQKISRAEMELIITELGESGTIPPESMDMLI